MTTIASMNTTMDPANPVHPAMMAVGRRDGLSGLPVMALDGYLAVVY